LLPGQAAGFQYAPSRCNGGTPGLSSQLHAQFVSDGTTFPSRNSGLVLHQNLIPVLWLLREMIWLPCCQGGEVEAGQYDNPAV